MIRIAIDCMGGDHGLSVTIPAALQFKERYSSVHIILVGLSDQIDSHLKQLNASHERIEVVHASEVVGMDDSVEIALRRKKNSSMRLAATLVKEGRADACISAGNTGAWMAVARYVLKTLDGIDRPAIATAIPTQSGVVTMLDLGANVDCTSEHLLQFGIMGVAFSQAVLHIENPTVGLLNIGEEAIKGNEVVKRAGELLRASSLSFYGNVEGNDIFKGTVDVVVSDGFVGNVVLKSSEGLARMIFKLLSDAFRRTWWTRILGICALPVLSGLRKSLDHRRYNGAALLGLNGVAIKSHGSADSYSFECALVKAYDAVSSNMLDNIRETMKELNVIKSSDQCSIASMVSEAKDIQ